MKSKQKTRRLLWIIAFSLVIILLLLSISQNQQALQILSQAVREPTLITTIAIPDNPDVSRLYGRALILNNRYQEALPVLESSITGFSAPLSYSDLCFIHWHNSEWLKALESCMAGEVHPHKWIAAGLGYEDQGDYAQALKANIMSVLIDPNFPSGPNRIMYMRGQVDPQVRIDILNSVIEVFPEHSAYFYFVLGEAYYRLDDYVLAEAMLKKTLELVPEFEQAQSYLNRLPTQSP